MGLRVLTGIIVTNTESGDVTISFNPHTVTGTDGQGSKMFARGDSGDFNGRPGRVFALRRLVLGEGQGHSLRIRDRQVTSDHVVVAWVSPENRRIAHISYMIVGEV